MMYENNRFYKGVSIVVSVLFLINNISQAAPDITYRIQKKSTLKEMSSANDGRTPAAIGSDLRAMLRETFPVKLVDKKKDGVDSSREPGEEENLATLIFVYNSSDNTLNRVSADIKPDYLKDVSSAAEVYIKGVEEFLKHNQEKNGLFLGEDDISSIFATNLHLEIVKDNDRLIDITPLSDDIASFAKEKEYRIRIDSDLVTQLGIYLGVNYNLRCKKPEMLRGAVILSALSFLHAACHMRGLSQRDAIHKVIDLYLTLSPKDKNALIEVLRTEKIDSGNAFNIFLHAITDTDFVEEVEDVDIRPYVNIASYELTLRIEALEKTLLDTRKVDDTVLEPWRIEIKDKPELKELAGALERVLSKRRPKADEEKLLKKCIEDMEATLKWRDKQVSWLMLLERIDVPFDYERVVEIMEEGYRKQASEEPLNVDDWHMQLHEAVTESFNGEIEDKNIFAIARWANQNGIRLVSGRLGRAFENQARMVSVAKYVTVTKELREAASDLRQAVSDMQELRNPAQKLVLLVTQATEPSYVELDIAIRTFEEAAADYKSGKTKELKEKKRKYGTRVSASQTRLQYFDQQIRELENEVNGILDMLEDFRQRSEEARKRDAAFVFLIQRLIPQETHKLAKAATFRDVDAGKEEDIRDLLRQGGHLAYCTPGQGNELNVLMFMDDIIEAIPMLVKERVIKILKPGADPKLEESYFHQTQAVVDQKAMEAFFRNIFAPNFLKNIKHAIDTQHIDLARQILFKTNKYRRIAERYKDLSFPLFMAATAQQAPEFPEDVNKVAALIDLSYRDLIDEITEYRNKEGCNRLTAVREVLLGKGRNKSKKNAIGELLNLLDKGKDVGEAIKKVTDVRTSDDWLGRFGKTMGGIAPYWDWRPRRTPTLHDLTTQAPGLTEAYIETWIEERMALLNILEDHPKVRDEVSKRRKDYKNRIINCTKKVLAEYGMEAVVEEIWHANNYKEKNQALLQVPKVYPSVAREVAKLAVLIKYKETKEGKKEIANVEDIEEVTKYIEKHGGDDDFMKKVIEKVVALNGLTLERQIIKHQRDHSTTHEEAALAAIMQDEGYKQDYESQKAFYARSKVLDILDEDNPEMMLKDMVNNYIRDHTDLSESTAIKEALAKHKLQHLINNARYHISADGPKKLYNLLYTPSRVNIGHRELESVQVWSQAIGAKGQEAARAGYDFYRLINAHPAIHLSPKIVEALKTAENGSMMSQLAFGNAVSLLVNFLGDGDAQRLLDEMMSRGDRQIPFGGEGYGGYCVPKDGLFLAFVVALSQEQKLAGMGVDSRFHQDILRLAKIVLMERPKRKSEFEWEMWAAEKILKYEELRKYVDMSKKGDSEEKILIFNITNLAKVIEGVGSPSYEIATGEKMLWKALAEWSIESTIVQAERINRMMPFVKAWMILRNSPNKVNLTVEYKSIDGTDKNVGDVRFATGIRVAEVLTGATDHLIRQLDPEGQNIARLLRFGFNLESKNENIKKASEWIMEKCNIPEQDTQAIKRLEELFPSFEPPKDIVLTATSGIPVGDIMNYTSDRQVSMDDLAQAAFAPLVDLGFTEKQIAASADVYGADISKWPKIEDNRDIDIDELLNSEIEVEGLDGNIYRYSLKSAMHYLCLKQRTIARSYETAIQGSDVVNLGVVSGALEKITKNAPKLITLMLSGQPLAEPVLTDGSPSKSGNAPRTFTDQDVKLFFAACENFGLEKGLFATRDNFGKRGRYEAIGWGEEDIERLRQTMQSHRKRALDLLNALDKVNKNRGQVTWRDNTIKEARRTFEITEYNIDLNNEAIQALKDEEMFRRWKRWQPRDGWISLTLSNLAAGLPLTDFDFGTWLGMGGMYLLAGKSQEEIDAVRKTIEEAIDIIRGQRGLELKTTSAGELAFSPEQNQECIQALLMPEYQPEVGEFVEQKLVEISSKAIEAGATQARERRKALAKRAAIARAKRKGEKVYKEALDAIKAEFLQDNKVPPVSQRSRRLLVEIQNRTKAIVAGERSQDNLDNLNMAYGELTAWVKTTFGLIIDKLSGRYVPEDAEKDKEVRAQLKRDLEEVFGINGFNVEAVKKFLGGYESDGDLAILAQAVSKKGQKVLRDKVIKAIELFYNLYGLAQTIEYLQVPKEDVDMRMFWDSVTVFFAETINDHFYEYLPWAYSRAKWYKRGKEKEGLYKLNELYKLAAEHHRWLYDYLYTIMTNVTVLSELPESEQVLILGDYSKKASAVVDAIGVEYERKPDTNELNEGCA